MINETCQFFDPMMILPVKEKDFESYEEYKGSLNTACVAKAYVYIEGVHGKIFLCDFHYFYQKDIITKRNPKVWPEVIKILIENLEDIKNEFVPTDGIQEISNDKKCWCNSQAYVSIMDKRITDEIIRKKCAIYMCNFHYRKSYYRHLSNNIPLEKYYIIRDERHRSNLGINEEFEQLTIL
jgi:hypothetical protein